LYTDHVALTKPADFFKPQKNSRHGKFGLVCFFLLLWWRAGHSKKDHQGLKRANAIINFVTKLSKNRD